MQEIYQISGRIGGEHDPLMKLWNEQLCYFVLATFGIEEFLSTSQKGEGEIQVFLQ